MRDPIRPRPSACELFLICASPLLAGTLLAAPFSVAQTPPAPAASDATQAPAHRLAAHRASKPKPAAVQTAPTAPPAPDWPINDRPSPASVAWSSSELHIDAANSSLQQILLDVSNATGADVEGLGKDERIFGAFGPGTAHDVLSQLLQGTGYNVVMVGDQGQGVPREIILSERNTSKTSQLPARPTSEEPEDEAQDYPQYDPQPQPQPQQQPQPPVRPGFPNENPGPLRNPQMQPLPGQPQQQTQPVQQPPNTPNE
jgi:hypothetical protein